MNARAQMLQLELDEAKRFVAALAGDGQVLVQTFDDGPHPKRKDLAATIDMRDDGGKARMLDLYERGAAVFVTVNEMQGTRRNKAATTRIRSLSIDKDDGPIEPVLTATVPPHVVIETSPKKWQAHWLVDASFPMERFDSMLDALVTRFGADPRAKGPERVLRIPGFLHRKIPSRPFMVRIERLIDAPRYDLATLDAWLSPNVTPARPAPRSERKPPVAIDPERAQRRGKKYLQTAPASVQGDGGNDVAHQVAKRLRDYGLEEDAALALMLEEWNDRCMPPWPDDELAVPVANAYRYAKEEQGTLSTDVVFAESGATPDAVPWPDYKRAEGGAIVASLANIKAALDRPDQCGARIAFDMFRSEIMFAPSSSTDWRPMADADYVRIRLKLESIGFRKVTTQDLRDVIQAIAEEQRFDSAVDWLTPLRWDGTPRVDRFFAAYFGVAPGPYPTAVSRYWWTGLAGRILAAPCQADMVPVLVGDQGIGKTQGCRAIAPAPEQFVEIDLGARDDDLARKMRGALVGEIGELRGLMSKDAEAVKQWVTRTEENWRQLYREFTTRYPRRLMMIATTNQQTFLADETGERRWLPMRSSGVDVDAIKRDREQLWAEGACLFREHGVLWQDASRLATDEHHDYKIDDAWSEPIERWLEGFGDLQPDARGFSARASWKRSTRPFRMGDALVGALGITAAGQTKAVQLRAGKILRAMGFEDGRYYFEGVQARGWQRVSPSDPTG